MKSELFFKVYHSDTDCYGVMWHGAYFRWLEAARIEYFDYIGQKFQDIENSGTVTPVAEITCRYKQSAKLYDELKIETELKIQKGTFMKFEQIIINVNSGQTIFIAEVKLIAKEFASLRKDV